MSPVTGLFTGIEVFEAVEGLVITCVLYEWGTRDNFSLRITTYVGCSHHCFSLF